MSTINTTVPSTSTGISFLPSDAWVFDSAATDATYGGGKFLVGDNQNGLANSFILYTFTQPATGFEYWAWQRSNGGLFSICFDCSQTYTLGDRIDALNTSTTGTSPPILLYSKYDLSYAVHNVTIANLFDQRATIGNATNGGYGQMSLDCFILITPSTPPSTSSSTTSTSASPSGTPSAGGALSGSSSNAGPITGGVVGGVAGLAIIALILWLFVFRNWDRRTSARDMNGGHGPVNYEPKDVPDLSGNPAAPFILGTQPHVYMPNQAMANRQGYTYQAVYQPAVTLSSSDPSTSVPNEYDAHAAQIAAVAAALPPRKGAPNMAAAPVMRSEQPVSPSVYPASSDVSAPSSGNATITISPRREQDAGFLQGDELEPPTLPPDYDAATLRRRAGQP